MVVTSMSGLARGGDWIQTFSGRPFWPLDPRPEDIFIEDIAHALAMKCRFGGHCMYFYSVAEHSVLVSRHVPRESALWGLLHDAAEAYTADVPTPLKRMFPEWQPMENRIMVAVCHRFGLPIEQPADVTAVDCGILTDEREAIMAPCERNWGRMAPPVGARITRYVPYLAEALFLQRFDELAEGL